MRIMAFLLGMHLWLGSWLPGANLSELAKLPHLYAHYREHQREAGGALTFADFLRMHYAENKHSHRNAADHNQLPGHAPHAIATLLFCQLPPQFAFRCQPLPVVTPLRDGYLSSVGVAALARVFQPPKA